MFIRLPAVALCVLLSLALSAQRNSVANDLILLQDGSRIEVDLKKNTLMEMGRAISFRRLTDEKMEKLGPAAVREFLFAKSNRRFRAVNVEIPDPNRNGEVRMTSRFGEVLVDGTVQLIRVNLAGNEYNSKALGMESYLYLLRQGEIELPLELTSILVYERLHANPSRFRNKLKFFVRDCPAALYQARRADFNDGDIMRVLDTYSRCKNIDDLSMNRNRIGGIVNFDHFGRIGNLNIRDMNYDDRQLSFSAGYLVEARFTNQLRRLGMAFSLDYVYHSFRWEETSNIGQSMLKGNFSVGYSPVLKEDFSVQVTAGLSNYNAFSSSFNSFFSNNYFLLSSGMRVRKGNYLLGISYEHMPNQIKRQPGNILLVSAGYRIKF